ncbi:dihydrolipoyllysine-residue acetyltransferase [Propionivibrio dicarboxylicus]|uniref:Acetyltransferase component of pyruvate dehydrogenase complex n=1 Tax=Propionivibrio dicarboxylicus TaxID=83767 RepID=A0A1G8MG80_9RHOO|nr:dihydrolipoyllysine-residue acetyltransferase [Propionivibrio dicarboxylicus]SDI66882.1 pyruvate dehydrogenase E2 component (dihydrolipoamide acetyltransferase) [Propionivibrio dicarboxylicus]
MSQHIEIKVPDIGDYTDIPVIELCVAVGDTVAIDDALVTLESDKATMDVPASAAGVVKELRVKLGDRVSQGSIVAIVEAAGAAAAPSEPVASVVPPPAAVAATPVAEKAPAAPPAPAAAPASLPPAAPPIPTSPNAPISHTHASPSVRLLARELGVTLTQVPASGPKSRILREDVIAYVKGVMQSGPVAAAAAPAPAGASLGGLDLLPWPKVDFEKFGPIERQPLSRIKKISGQNLARNWVMIPAVTYHDEADITELEAFRLQVNKENEKGGAKITMLAFVIKACQIALAKYPEFNSSLDGDSLVLKKYFNIGFAADTPHGLVVPVIKNVDQKSVSQLAVECGELARKARDGKLGPADMSGACFTISSVGGIGGTSFSPIVNAPEVAILGVSKSVMKPVWNGETFIPRLILPLSLSADHRVIDGALGTRFNAYVAQLLSDMRRALI